MTKSTWSVRLSASAEADFRQILRWTSNHFGTMQAKIYAETLSSAMQALCAGPTIIGAIERPEIGANIRTLHIARNGRKGRHIIVFRISGPEGSKEIDILRVLHDSMDLERHLPPQG